MLSIPRLLFAVLVSVIVVRPPSLEALDVYVSPRGLDSAPGTSSEPVATLEQALSKVRNARAAGATIWLEDGFYTVGQTVDMTAFDSGTAASPLTISAVPGAEPVLVGGRTLEPTAFRSVETYDAAYPRLSKQARKRVLVCQIDGTAAEGASKLEVRGISNRKPAAVEVIIGGKPLALAGWPDVGQEDPAGGIENGFFSGANAVADHTVSVHGAPVERWKGAREAWAHGYWHNDWADTHLKIASVDSAKATLTFGSIPSFGFGKDRPVRVYNLPEELSSIGEYWIDHEAGLLYLWPTADFGNEPIYLSELKTPLVRLASARHITFRGITFEAARERLVEVRDGVGIVFDRCRFRNSGTDGLLLQGRENLVASCEFYRTGAAGVDMAGGDRKQLIRGNNLVINSFFHDLGRHYLHNSAAVLIYGVGNDVRNNLIVRLPHTAIQYSGNLHEISGNEIVAVCNFSGDSGAIYTGRDWAGYGNVVQANIVRDIQSRRGTENWVHGVYLDDCASGSTIRGNIFENIGGSAVNVGGGRSNVIENNVIANCGFSGHINDNRGLKWASTTPGDSWNLLEQLDRLGVRKGLWASLFPELAQTPAAWAQVQGTELLAPKGSVFARNVGWGNKQFAYEQDWAKKPNWIFGVYKEFGSNDPRHAPLFTREDLGASNRRGEIAASVEGFKPINAGNVGVPAVYAVDEDGRVAFKDGSFRKALANTAPVKAPASSGGVTIGSSLEAEYFLDVKGETIDKVPGVGAPVSMVIEIDELALPSNMAQNYATRVRGYIVPPESGLYSFWIAGDDAGQFSLSNSDDPAGLRVLAKLPSHVSPGEWSRHKGQQSEPVLLTVAQRYYFELVHKQGWGGDFLEVAWAGPSFERTRVGSQNLQPLGTKGPSEVVAQAGPMAPDSHVEHAPGSDSTGRSTAGINGKVQVFFFDSINGERLSSLMANARFPSSPNSSTEISKLEIVNRGDNYGALTFGYIVPPSSGSYTFYVSADDDGELWLSTDSTPGNARLIARSDGYTRNGDFTARAVQKSSPITLQAGRRYYFQGLLKEAWSNDHLQIAWEGPGLSRQIIGSAHLATYGSADGQ